MMLRNRNFVAPGARHGGVPSSAYCVALIEPMTASSAACLHGN